MAHIHGAAKVPISSHLAKAGAEKAMEHGMEGMMKQMMGEGMKHGMGQAATSFHNIAKGAAATGALASASSHTGRSFMGKIFKHPLVLFGMGVAAGYMIHKYRKEIIASADRMGEMGKDFVLQQRENLEDLVAESREVKGE